ncbi:MAG: hypothetical protein ACI4VW_04670 [Acutalibacteraceae bacterium]
MKRLITVVAVALLIGCIAFVFTGCGGNDGKNVTSTTIPATSNSATQNPGVVTDESEKGDNGVLGDIVTDISEGVSDAVTDVSEGISDIAR